MMLASTLSKMAGFFVDGSNPRDPALAKFLGIGQASKAGVRVDHDSVIALPAIKRAVQIISDKLYGMPWYVFEEEPDGRVFSKDHPSWNCVAMMGNREISAAAIRQQLTQWAMLYGNGVAVIYAPDWPNYSKPELLPLNPDRTDLVRLTGLGGLSSDLYESGELRYRTWIDNQPFYFPQDQVIHIKGLGPNIYWGWSIFELLRETFGGAIAKDEYTQRFFGQGAQPSGFIEMPGTLDEESEENYIRSMKAGMHGLGNAHKFVLLEEGAKFHESSFDPQKSQMLEGRQFDIRLLAMAIGIKVHKLIDGANSAFASLEQANHEHKDDDVMPWVNKWRTEYNTKLLRPGERSSMSHSIDIDDESLDWVPFSERASGSVELYNNGLITKDEGRRKVNFGPSRSSRAKQFRIPANIVFEDDQALLASRAIEPQKEPDQDDSPEETQPDDKSAELAEVTEAYLAKISTRLNRTAADKAGRSSKEFISWLDGLKPEAGPASIQSNIDSLYASFSHKMNGYANTAKTDQELKEMVCEAT